MTTARQNTVYAKRRGAFTLVELLVVIAIIGILISVLLSAVWSFRNRQRQVQSDTTARNIATAIRGYRTEYHRWPIAPGGTPMAGGVWSNNNYLVMQMLLPNHAQNIRYMPFWETTNHAAPPPNGGIKDGYGDWYTIRIDVSNNEVTVSSPHSDVSL